MIPVIVQMQLATDAITVPVAVASDKCALGMSVGVDAVVPMHLAAGSVTVPVAFASDKCVLGMAVGVEIVAGQYADYDGQYNFTPSNDEIVVETADLHLTRDIVINPIPSNYGKITYNGSVITVS